MTSPSFPELIDLGDRCQDHKQVISAHVLKTVSPSSATRDYLELDKASYLLPEGTFDTHVHVFDPRLGPYSPSRAYTPERASFASLTAFGQTLSLSAPARAATFVLIQPSPYGTDNRVLLHILEQCRSRGVTARGIVVVDVDTITDAALEEMHELGVRGLRLNLQADGEEVNVESLHRAVRAAAERISRLPEWKLQIYAPSHSWTELHDTITSLPVSVIVDHIGGLYGVSKLPLELMNDPMQQSGFQTLISLAKACRIYIKISGLYRASDNVEDNYSDMESIIRRLAAEVPNRLIWGSDWPHTGEGKDRVQNKNKNIETIEPFREIDSLGILRNLKEWMGNEETWMKMMVDTPRVVFR